MHPYMNLPDKAFWSKAVAQNNVIEMESLWKPKRKIRSDQVFATFGSCFAQHIGRALVARGLLWLDAEQAPKGLPDEVAKNYNYGIFSARTGNIYTANQLVQWIEWSTGVSKPPSEVWELDGRFYDPFRPRVEPNGFETVEELLVSREETQKAFRNCIKKSDVFVFTMGLTEGWINIARGYEYAACPGTVSGTFDEKLHKFVNFSFADILKSMKRAQKLARSVNPSLRFLLTVSPVPLTATASDQHVLVANVRSKSTLRAVAAQLTEDNASVDYFPSYEIVSSPWFETSAFEANQRSVRPEAVAAVMTHFFADSPNAKQVEKKIRKAVAHHSDATDDELVCEESLLDAFSNGEVK